MNTKHLKARILDLALQGKLVENSRIPNDLNSRIPSDFNPPFEIPNSWAWVKLGEIAKIKGGKRIPAGKKLLEEKTPYPYIRVTDFLSNGTINENSLKYTSKEIYEILKNYKVLGNDLCICIAGSIGKSCVINEKLKGAILTENAVRLEFIKNISQNFIYYFVKSNLFFQQVNSAIKHTAQPKLAIIRLSNFYIPLPPLDEQEKIVKKIDELFSQIDILETSKQNLLKNIKHTKARILDLALQGKLVENSRIPNDLNSRIPSDFNPPFEIPNSWAWVKLGDICNPKQWTTISTEKLKENGKYSVYGANGIIGKYDEYNHEKETILITCRGATCGSINICEPFSYVNGNAFALDNLDENIYLKFMYFCLNGINFKDIITGTAQPQIVKKNLIEFYIPLPPLDEQERIVKKIDELFEILEVIENSL